MLDELEVVDRPMGRERDRAALARAPEPVPRRRPESRRPAAIEGRGGPDSWESPGRLARQRTLRRASRHPAIGIACHATLDRPRKDGNFMGDAIAGGRERRVEEDQGYGRNSREEARGPRHRAADAGGAGRQLCAVRAHRQFHGGVRPALPRRRRQAGRQGPARRRRLDRGRPEGGARLRDQSAGADQGRARRSRQDRARGAARRLHQFGARLHRRPEGDERRLRPDGRGVRRQGPPCPHHGRRRRRCRSMPRSRSRPRSRCPDASPSHDARLADRAPDRPSRPARRRPA